MTESKFKAQINKIKSALTVDDIIDIVSNGLEAGPCHYDGQGNPIFMTICHNAPGEGSYKLYYYTDSSVFHCFTQCGDNFDIFELVRRAKGYGSFVEAYRFVCQYFNLHMDAREEGFRDPEPEELTDDWALLNKIKDYNAPRGAEIVTEPIPQELINYYIDACPIEWVRQGILTSVMKKYNIRVDGANQKVIIPHYDINGQLIGIRGRSYNPIDLDQGKKYMPVILGDKLYNHPLGAHLYGLDKNKETIQRLHKVCIVEAEKSVLLAEGYYPGNNFVVATCGSSGLSDIQIGLLLDLGVREVIIAYDRENDDDKESEKTKEYEDKLLKIAQPLTLYFDVSVLFDYSPYTDLQLQDSPFDRGPLVLEKLMKNKYHVLGPDIEYKKRKG